MLFHGSHALIGGYAQLGHREESFEVFAKRVESNQMTYMTMLNACACPTD